jgi:transcriptional regulator with XRE-family HTH domain
VPSSRVYLAVVRARIRASRIAKNLSQDEVASAAGLETRTYQHLENPAPSRKFNPRFETLIAVADAIGIDLTKLVAQANDDEIQALEKQQAVQRMGRKRSESQGKRVRGG